VTLSSLLDWLKGHSDPEIMLARAVMKFVVGDRLAALFDVLNAIRLMLPESGQKNVQLLLDDLAKAGFKP